MLLDLKYEFSELLKLVRVTLALGHLPVQERSVEASLGRVLYSDYLGTGNHLLLLLILESLVDELFFLFIITVFTGRDLLEVHWGGRILFHDYLDFDGLGQLILVR